MLLNKIRITSNYVTKYSKFGIYYYNNIRTFDLNYKINGELGWNTFDYLNQIKINYTIPLIPLPSDFFLKTKLVLNSSKIISLFSWKLPKISSYKNIQQQKKKIQVLIIKNFLEKKKIFNNLNFLLTTFLPFLKNSKNQSFLNILSDNSGNFFFFIKDISFFNDKLDESFIGWDKKVYLNISCNSLKKNNIITTNYLNKIIFSSVGLICRRGHGGWLPFSFSKFFIVKNFSRKKKQLIIL